MASNGLVHSRAGVQMTPRWKWTRRSAILAALKAEGDTIAAQRLRAAQIVSKGNLA